MFTGVVEDVGTVEGARALERSLRRLLHDPEKARELGRIGRATFERRWSPDAHLEAYLGVVRRVAREKHGRIPWKEEKR